MVLTTELQNLYLQVQGEVAGGWVTRELRETGEGYDRDWG